jgi:hypothetical protein
MARRSYFASTEQHRYDVEPDIPTFADLGGSRDLRVLEIGVGAGTDHVNWLRAWARAVGIDLTTNGVRLTRERAELEGLNARVFVADAEALPFRTRRPFAAFSQVTVTSRLGPGDLLTVKPSARYSSRWMQLAWRLYPRWMVRLLGDRFGLGLLVHAVK